MFVPFPFNQQDMQTGLAHMMLGWRRRLLNQKSDHYASRYLDKAESGQFKVELLPERRVCNICGFAVVKLVFPNSWEMETCSSYDLKKTVLNTRLLSWLEELSKQSALNLQLPGD